MGKLKVRDLKTDVVFSVRRDEDLSKINDLMLDKRIRHIPVVDSDENIVGLVSLRDLLRSALDNVGVLPDPQQKELLQSTLVEEIMVADPETADPEMDLADAGRLLLDNKWGCLPVTDGEHLVGILTESDFVKYIVERAED